MLASNNCKVRHGPTILRSKWSIGISRLPIRDHQRKPKPMIQLMQKFQKRQSTGRLISLLKKEECPDSAAATNEVQRFARKLHRDSYDFARPLTF
jgi:hypothetical protein